METVYLYALTAGAVVQVAFYSAAAYACVAVAFWVNRKD